MKREQVEEKRGIVRDEAGRIVRSKDWIKDRINALKVKRDDMEQRIKNINLEIEARTSELKNTK